MIKRITQPYRQVLPGFSQVCQQVNPNPRLQVNPDPRLQHCDPDPRLRPCDPDPRLRPCDPDPRDPDPQHRILIATSSKPRSSLATLRGVAAGVRRVDCWQRADTRRRTFSHGSTGGGTVLVAEFPPFDPPTFWHPTHISPRVGGPWPKRCPQEPRGSSPALVLRVREAESRDTMQGTWKLIEPRTLGCQTCQELTGSTPCRCTYTPCPEAPAGVGAHQAKARQERTSKRSGVGGGGGYR